MISCNGSYYSGVEWVSGWKHSAVWSAGHGCSLLSITVSSLCSIPLWTTTCWGCRVVPSTEPAFFLFVEFIGVPGSNAAVPTDGCREHCTCNNRLIKIHPTFCCTNFKKLVSPGLILLQYSFSVTYPYQSIIQLYSQLPVTLHLLHLLAEAGNVVHVRTVPPEGHDHSFITFIHIQKMVVVSMFSCPFSTRTSEKCELTVTSMNYWMNMVTQSLRWSKTSHGLFQVVFSPGCWSQSGEKTGGGGECAVSWNKWSVVGLC